MAKALCSRATSLPSCRIGVTSAYAKLSKYHSARSLSDPPDCQKNRTFLIRADLWRLVERERSCGCKSSCCAIRRTLSALDKRVTVTQLTPVAVNCRGSRVGLL